MSTRPDRDLDIVLVGATGFVGRLTARHLAEHAPSGIRIGLAGRSAERLAALQQTLPEVAASWPLITVDVLDDGAVAELAGRCRVVASYRRPVPALRPAAGARLRDGRDALRRPDRRDAVRPAQHRRRPRDRPGQRRPDRALVRLRLGAFRPGCRPDRPADRRRRRRGAARGGAARAERARRHQRWHDRLAASADHRDRGGPERAQAARRSEGAGRRRRRSARTGRSAPAGVRWHGTSGAASGTPRS